MKGAELLQEGAKGLLQAEISENQHMQEKVFSPLNILKQVSPKEKKESYKPPLPEDPTRRLTIT